MYEDVSIMMLSPSIPLVIAGIVHVTKFRKSRYSLPTVVVLDFVLAIILHILLLDKSSSSSSSPSTTTTTTTTTRQYSIIPWWNPITFLLSQWYQLDMLMQYRSLRNISNGPLGTGAYKLIQIIVGVILWRILKQEWPDIKFGPPPKLIAWIYILLISIMVNIVLAVWSQTMNNSRGRHKGVNEMVQSSLNRSLTIQEHIQYTILAFVNATCEEITSRYFWYTEFATFYTNTNPIIPNLGQAIIFGICHYYGVPSGIVGVILTFVYGYIMGLVKETIGHGGLIVPIIAHTIADYYIFSIIARGKAGTMTKKA